MSSSELKVIFGPRVCGDYSDEIQRIVAYADGSAHTETWNFQTRTWQRGGRFSDFFNSRKVPPELVKKLGLTD
jgi:hypothetical protein